MLKRNTVLTKYLTYYVRVLSMKQLRDRVMKLREDHDHIYHLSRTEGKPSINWGTMMDDKLVGLMSQGCNCAPGKDHTHKLLMRVDVLLEPYQNTS